MREKKLHYKMYKDGKKFVFAAIATLSFFVFGGVSTVEVHADTTSGNLTAATVNSTSDTKSAAQSAATAVSSATKTDSTSASSSSAAKAETTGASSSSATKADSTSASSSSATKADSTSASSSSATKADSTSASSSSAVKTETTSASSQKTSSVKSQAQSLTATTTGKAVRATSTSVKKNSAQTKVSYSTLLQQLRTSKAPASDEAALAHVDKDNFLEYFRLNGSATYDAKTGIVTITPDQNNQVGNFSLTSKIDMNNSFTLTGQVNLGSNPNGADGIGFAFHSGNTTDVGIAGGNLGIGGLQDAIGFKLDTFSNNYQVPLSNKNGSEISPTDPDGFGCNGDPVKAPYGTFVKTSNQEISTWNHSKVQRWWAQNTGKSQALSKADIDGHFHDFVVNYDGATRTLTVSYTQASGKPLTWTTTVASSDQAMAMIVSASTGAYKNLQQFKLTSFDFHEAATVNVKYVDTTGHQLAQGTVNYPDGAYVNGRYTTKQLAIPNYTFIKMDDKSLAANGTLTHAGDNGTVIYVYAPAMTVTTESKKVNETVHYQGAGNQTPADHTAQVTFTRQGSTDAVTGETTYGPWSADQSFDAVKSPELKGYTADKAQIDEQTVNGDSKNLEFTVTYTADKQKGSVSYVDDTTGKTLKTDSISGTTGSKSSYSTSGSIADYKKQGYELVTDGYPADFTFDNDDTTDQNFTVHLKHQLTPVNPTDPQTPGAPINPDEPDGPKWPTSTNYDKTVNETVSYVDQNGHVVAKQHTDSVNFTRTVVVDNVTGKVITSGAGTTAWTATNGDTTFDAVVSPVVPGYVADKAQTAAVTGLNADSADVNETVTYTKVGSLVPSSSDGNFPGAPTVVYPNDPSDATKVTPAGVPTVPGYTAHDPEGHVLTPGSRYQPSDPTKDTTITYTADKQKGSVSYVDDTTGKTLKTDSISGTTGSKSSYSTSGSIADYKKQGYELVTDGYPADFTFDNDDTTDQNFTVHLKHQNIQSTEAKTVTETIHYQGAGNQTPADHTAQVTFTRQGSTDAVTGETTYGPWSADQSFDAVKSPELKGYTADKAQIDEQTVNGDSKDLEFTVTYTADNNGGTGLNQPGKPGNGTDTGNPSSNQPGNPSQPSNATNNGVINTSTNTGSKVNNGAVNSPELPQTGENNSQSQTMSFIGILLALFGSLLGFLGIKKRRND